MSPSDQSFRRGLGDVGNPPLPLGIGTAGESLTGFDAADEIARRMAFDAMARTIHEIGAPVPLSRFGWIRLERLDSLKNRNFQPPRGRRRLKGNGTS